MSMIVRTINTVQMSKGMSQNYFLPLKHNVDKQRDIILYMLKITFTSFDFIQKVSTFGSNAMAENNFRLIWH